MEYLVESHMGGYYVSDMDPEIITQYCESCGDSDWILLSWEKGNMMESLIKFFSELKMDIEEIENDIASGISKPDEIEDVLFKYEQDKYIISSLFEKGTISDIEKTKLMKVNYQARKDQITKVCEIYPKTNKSLKRVKEN